MPFHDHVSANSKIKRPILLLMLILIFANEGAKSSAGGEEASVMSGLSNHGQTKTGGYITAGDRIYLIGTQDGNFPDMGRHVEGEMGGLWLPPIKLIDGFWAKLTDVTSGEAKWLTDAAEFVNYPYGNEFKYVPVLDGVEVRRFQFCPDGRQGIVIQYAINNSSNRKRNLKFAFSVKTDLSPVWLSDQIGIKDDIDKVSWDAKKRFLAATDNANPWYAVWGAASSRRSLRWKQRHPRKDNRQGNRGNIRIRPGDREKQQPDFDVHRLGIREESE